MLASLLQVILAHLINAASGISTLSCLVVGYKVFGWITVLLCLKDGDSKLFCCAVQVVQFPKPLLGCVRLSILKFSLLLQPPCGICDAFGMLYRH